MQVCAVRACPGQCNCLRCSWVRQMWHHAQQYWAGPKDDYSFIPVKALTEAFTHTQTYQHNMNDLAAPYESAANARPELDPLVHDKCAPTP